MCVCARLLCHTCVFCDSAGAPLRLSLHASEIDFFLCVCVCCVCIRVRIFFPFFFFSLIFTFFCTSRPRCAWMHVRAVLCRGGTLSAAESNLTFRPPKEPAASPPPPHSPLPPPHPLALMAGPLCESEWVHVETDEWGRGARRALERKRRRTLW